MNSGKNILFRMFNLTTMSLAKYFRLISIFFDIGSLKLAADCPRKCEQSRGSISKTGIKNRAMQGHSFKNYTLSKPYNCHVNASMQMPGVPNETKSMRVAGCWQNFNPWRLSGGKVVYVLWYEQRIHQPPGKETILSNCPRLC